MPRIIHIVLIVALLACSTAHAKLAPPRRHITKMDLGIKLGGNFEGMKGSGWGPTYQVGYHGGGFIGFREQVFGVQGELLVRSAKYQYGGGISNLYLSVPVLFQVRLVDRVWLQLGPQYSFLLRSKYDATEKSTDIFAPGAFAGVMGIQMFLTKNVTMGVRYSFGLSSWQDKESTDRWKERSALFFLGFSFY